MIRQLILIDQSIEDTAGHYLEYARRVLRAAKDEGFRTVLAVNVRAQNIDCPDADLILRIFSKNFWENQAQSKIRTMAGLVGKKGSLTPLPSLSRRFANELRGLIVQAGITEKDIVFVPTLGGTELLGISLYSGTRTAVKINWHLLFRRDVPPPRSFLDVRSHHTLAKIREAFIEAKSRFKNGSRNFYTDTDQLTERYQKLGIGKFKTLPIPIDDQMGMKIPWRIGPLLVSYMGDIREEKGIHLLPKLISGLRKDGFGEDKAKFRIQGNLPTAGANLAAKRAKFALLERVNAGVEILEGPFDSEVYRRLILSADVILIPYCPRRYAARSSGIFTEALAAGIPTIYPTGSWMEINGAGTMAVGYKNASELADRLKSVLDNYPSYQLASLEYSMKWRETHSAKRLFRLLIENTENH
jgi:glycosyltransferase involved in cell wall biosynthesis